MEYLILLFLGIVFISSLFESKTKIPYTVYLIIIGLILSLLIYAKPFNYTSLDIKNLQFDPKLIMDFVIPPLIFEAMMQVDYYREFKPIRITVISLSTVGVVITTLVIGIILTYFVHLSFSQSIIFAALISSTDAAIVIQTFKKIKVPKLLARILEMESSFNDATSIIILSTVTALFIGTNSAFVLDQSDHNYEIINWNSVFEGIEHFLFVLFGGIFVGLLVAIAGNRLHALMNDPFSETALTITVVFGSVILANSLGVSGLVAVATAGLFFGNITMKKESTISKDVRNTVSHFWQIAAFFANSVIFLYLGITMNVINIIQNIGIIILGFVIVLFARAVAVYPILLVVNKFTKEKIPKVWRNIIVIGGMRGALSVALVTSLPEGEIKNKLEVLIFGVVLISLIIQYILLTKYVYKKSILF
ncbi:MAG TPA: sodium:proton antiporter [Verrucomicrobiae bacterium]|nr:sodium:proton antiporter [Verrucomicrobiae bacterium]